MPTTDQKGSGDAGQVGARPRVELGGAVAGSRDLVLEPAVATDAVQADDGERDQRRHDHEELQHLVVDRRREAAEADVGEHDGRGHEQRDVEVPAQQQVDDLGQQEQVDARDQQLRQGEAERVDEVGAGAEPLAHELGDRADLGAVVERHHHDAEEQHRRDGADPEVVHRRDAELRAVGGHAHDLDGAEVGGDERQSGDPRRQRTAGEEEVEAARHRAPGHDADADDEAEVERDQQVVDPVRVET